MRVVWLTIVFAATAVMVIAVIVLALLAKPAEHFSFFENDGIMVMAHRGGAQLRPANTLAAFEHAVELGVDALEMDVFATRDGTIVVTHDETVEFTTNGEGSVQQMALAELKELDAGYRWTNDGGQTYPYRGKGITIPTLEEVLRAFPDQRMAIELKQQTPSIVGPVCELIRKHGMTDRVALGSFKSETTGELRDLCRDMPTGMSETEIRNLVILNLLRLGGFYRASGQSCQVPQRSGSIEIPTPRFVSAARNRNIAVQVWTINDRAEMERLAKTDIHAIITDRPDLLLEVLGRTKPESAPAEPAAAEGTKTVTPEAPDKAVEHQP